MPEDCNFRDDHLQTRDHEGAVLETSADITFFRIKMKNPAGPQIRDDQKQIDRIDQDQGSVIDS